MSDSEPFKASASVEGKTPSVAPSDSSDVRRSVPAAVEGDTAALVQQLTVGKIIDGKYKIDGIIGKGAMGVVLAATHVHLKERVALKFLSTSSSVQSEDFRQRFRREAQVSAKLKNEHITRVLDVGMWREQYPFMVMDFLVGQDLRVVLNNAPDRRLPAGCALDYIVQVCEGLAEAHSHGIVHRDLKPSNLFITKRQDGSDLVKILDFGISKWNEQREGGEDELTQAGVVLGSPKYMSPEQLFGASEVDSRADIWSLGAIFYETLCGRPPYDFPSITRLGAALASGKPPQSLLEIVPDLHPGLEAVVMKCFAIEREDRMPNVAALAGELLDAIGAPFAGQVRQRIGVILDPRKVGDSPLSSSGALALGPQSYKDLALSSSSHSAVTSTGAHRQLSESGASSSTSASGSSQITVPSSRKNVILASAAVAAVAVVSGAIALGTRHHEVPTDTHVATQPTTITSAASAVSTAASSEQKVATGTSASSAASAAPADAAAVTAPTTPAGNRPPPTHWTPPPRNPGNAPKPPPTPATTPTAVAPPPPAPTPTPTTPKNNANPLEDRQ
jgi:serine/threonine-protein kinase